MSQGGYAGIASTAPHDSVVVLKDDVMMTHTTELER